MQEKFLNLNINLNYVGKFLNLNINLNYVGKIPQFEYYKGVIDFEQYDKLVSIYQGINWCLREELLSYCKRDVQSL